MKIKDLKKDHPAIYESAINYLLQLPLGGISETGPEIDDFKWNETNEGFLFWDKIDAGNFQVFYDRYPKYAKEPVDIKEKDWSKATEAELIAEAERRYPKGTMFKGVSGIEKDEYIIVGQPYEIKCNEHGVYCGNSYLFDRSYPDIWAEIIKQPVKLTDTGALYNSPIESEPKAGDMVDASDTETFSDYWRVYFTGGKTKSGYFITETNDGKFEEFKHIRLPKKSEVESKAKELMNQWYHEPSGAGQKAMLEMLIEIAKWGQANPDKI